MKRFSNINEIPKEYIDDADFVSKMKTAFIGDAIGSENFYVNIYYIKPGGKSVKYHIHSRQEEFFLILSGTGILRMNEEEIHIKTGDVISKPAGNAHQFINNGLEILQILDIGTRETEDIITYPDENVVYIKNKKLAFATNNNLKNWNSEPND